MPTFTQDEKDALFANLDAKLTELEKTAGDYENPDDDFSLRKSLLGYDNIFDNADKKKIALENAVNAIKATFVESLEVVAEQNECANVKEYNVDLDAFNKSFETLTQNIALQRGSISTKMSKSEEYLSELRTVINNHGNTSIPKKDMYVETLSALFREQIRINNPEDKKSIALGELVESIQKLAQETNPMKFYQAIVEWETLNKSRLSEKRGFFAPKSNATVDALKREIILQAWENKDLNTVDERYDFIRALKMKPEFGHAEETRLLGNLFPQVNQGADIRL